MRGFGDGDVLLVRVEHEDGVGRLLQVAQTTEVLLQLGELAVEQQRLFLDHDLGLAGGHHALVLEHLGDALGDRLEVREHAAEPPLVHVGHAALVGVALDGVLRLLLGADEEDRAATGDEIADEAVGLLDAGQRLLQIDDVDAVALTEDETLHLRVPPTGLVTEVCSGLQHLTHADDSHGVLLVAVDRTGRRPKATALDR